MTTDDLPESHCSKPATEIHCRWGRGGSELSSWSVLDFSHGVGFGNALEKMQPRPVPLVAKLSQQAITWGESQVGVVVCGEGRADAAMAMERTVRRDLGCIFELLDGGVELKIEGWNL